jgi:hypothetical protein
MVPDAAWGRITSTSVLQLQGKAGVEPTSVRPPISLRRLAQEADIKHEKALEGRKGGAIAQIDFGCSLPFKSVTELIQLGFIQAKANFSKHGDMKVLDHYQMAMNCLADNIDDPACQLMLMLILVRSASETPRVEQPGSSFTATAKRKDLGRLALVTVTRMTRHL